MLTRVDYQNALLRPSPNCEPRKDGVQPTIIVLHYTGMENAEAAELRLADPQAKVSAHYVVREDGVVVQMVAEKERAWHAGQSYWRGIEDVNSHSIGIEIVNAGPLQDFPEFSEKQIESVIALCADIKMRFDIEDRNIIGHSDIAPDRKIDPGEKFPWDILSKIGIGHWVVPEAVSGGRFMSMGENGQPVAALQSMLALYGYGLPITGMYDDQTRLVVEAFQRHFRPAKIDGVADQSTIKTLHQLLGTLKSLS